MVGIIAALALIIATLSYISDNDETATAKLGSLPQTGCPTCSFQGNVVLHSQHICIHFSPHVLHMTVILTFRSSWVTVIILRPEAFLKVYSLSSTQPHVLII